MNDTQTLTVLLEQAERQRDLALAEHQRAQTASEMAQAQAEQLIVYRRDYEQRWSAQFCREGKMELVRCYQGFVERLTKAVTQQEAAARLAAEKVEQAGETLRTLELRVAAVRKLIERRLLELRLAEERREQKQSDEMASRAAWNRSAGLGQAHLA